MKVPLTEDSPHSSYCLQERMISINKYWVITEGTFKMAKKSIYSQRMLTTFFGCLEIGHLNFSLFVKIEEDSLGKEKVVIASDVFVGGVKDEANLKTIYGRINYSKVGQFQVSSENEIRHFDSLEVFKTYFEQKAMQYINNIGSPDLIKRLC